MPKNKNSRGLNIATQEAIAGYLFILPTYIFYTIFVIIPVIAVVCLGFTQYDILSPPKFVGFHNFIDSFKDSRLIAVYGNTFYFTIVSVLLNVSIGLLLALMLNRKISNALKYLFRLAFFFPSIVATVFISVIWIALFAKDTGIVNYYLSLIGIHPIAWFNDPQMAMSSIILLDIWKNTGFAMIVFLAGLQNIPKDYYEASEIDGANTTQIFFKITFPLLSPIVFFNIIIFSIGALQVFDSTKIMTDGGPGDSTRGLVMYIYENAFQKFQMGYASAIAIEFLVVIVLLTMVQFVISRRWVNY
jgi:multiple sugar transport system permease protein